jgi:hypothetical protein
VNDEVGHFPHSLSGVKQEGDVCNGLYIFQLCLFCFKYVTVINSVKQKNDSIYYMMVSFFSLNKHVHLVFKVFTTANMHN